MFVQFFYLKASEIFLLKGMGEGKDAWSSFTT